MSGRVDHAAEAAAILAEIQAGMRPEVVSAAVAGAQVHATLALVEQQRIANGIAYHAAGMHSRGIDGPGLPGPHEQARKGLGL